MIRLLKSTVLVLVVVSCSTFGATATRSSIGGRIDLAIDGVACGRVASFEGGDPRASVVVTNSGGSALPKKSLGNVTYAPITVELTFPLAQPVIDWIGDLGSNSQKRRTVLLTPYNVSGQLTGIALEALNTLLTEVRFPAFDASSRDAAHLTLVFTPESTRVPTGKAPTSTTTITSGASKTAALSNFKIQIAGVDTSHVMAIDAFTITVPVAAGAAGEIRESMAGSGPPVFSNLILTVSSTDLAAWNIWRDNFVVKGMSDDASEKSGSLTIFASDMTTSLFALQFSHLGILRASPLKVEAGSEAVSKFQAELYYESISTGIPGTPAGASSSSAAAGGAGKKSGSADESKAGTSAESDAKSEKTGGADSAKSDGTAGAAKKDSSDQDAKSEASADASGKSGTADASGGADKKGGSDQDSKAGASAEVSGKSDASSGGASKAGAAGGADKKSGSDQESKGGASSAKSDPSVVSSPTDQGGRDPANFPRPDGLVRKSYSSIRQKTGTQEIAVYTSKSTLDALEELYTKNLTSAGWELTSRYENNFGTGARHQIILNLKNGLRSVAVTVTDYKDAGSEISVNLTTASAAAK